MPSALYQQWPNIDGCVQDFNDFESNGLVVKVESAKTPVATLMINARLLSHYRSVIMKIHTVICNSLNAPQKSQNCPTKKGVVSPEYFILYMSTKSHLYACSVPDNVGKFFVKDLQGMWLDHDITRNHGHI